MRLSGRTLRTRLTAAAVAAVSAAAPATAASFTDVTAEAGLTGVIGYRCSVGDLDGDGYPDLVLHLPPDFASPAGVQNTQQVFLNRPGAAPGARRFVDFTTESGARRTRTGAATGHQSDGAIMGDVDNDGDLDVFFFVYVHDNYALTGRSDLMLNDGAARFTYAPNSPFHQEAVPNTTDALFVDYDNDGNVDIFTGDLYWNGQPTFQRLYRGQGNGSFTNVSGPSGVGSRANVLYAVASFDWNNDGFMDLFAPTYDYLNSALTPVHWKNNGNGTFTQWQATSHYSDNRGYLSLVASFGSMPRDYDNDGDVDFFEILVHGGTQRQKYSGPVENRAGVFVWDWSRFADRATEDPNITHDGDHQASWWDYDGNMVSDVVLTESFYNNNRLYLLRQGPDGIFRPATNGTGLEAINALNRAAYDVIPLDFDRDGDEDLLVGFAEVDVGVQLWRNDVGTANHWLSLTLEGGGAPGRANRAGIGARIEVTAGGVTQTREVYAGIGQHAPQAPLTQTFGLAAATVIDRIRVRWPNPTLTVTEIPNVGADRFLTIREVCPGVPSDPAGLLVAKSGPDLVLSWNEGGLAWNVYRETEPDPAWGPPVAYWVADGDATAPGVQYRDAGATAGTSTFFYLVTGVDDCGESPLP